MNLNFLPWALLLWLLPLTAVDAQLEAKLSASITPAVLDLTLPVLDPLEGVDVPAPYHELFIIFNDGQFYMDTVGRYEHAFDNILLDESAPAAAVYSKGIYSDQTGDEPPKIASDPTSGVPPPSLSPSKMGRVPDTAFITLTPDHPNIVPGRRSIVALSAKNNLPNSPTSGLTAYLLYFYNSQLEVAGGSVVKKEGGTLQRETVVPKKANVFVTQNLEDAPLPLLNRNAFDVLSMDGKTAGDRFKSLKVFALPSFTPGQELHYFLPLDNEELHLGQIPEGGQGSVDYAAVLLLQRDGNFTPPPLSNEASEQISKLGIEGLLEEGLPLSTFGDPSDTIGQQSGLLVAAYTEVQQRVRPSYDPNQISLWGCECPADADAAQKVLCKVEFENEGMGATGAVAVRVPLPDGFDVSTVPDSLFTLSAGIATVTLERDLTANELRVVFPKLRLAGTAEGASFAARSGYFSFYIYTKPGTDLADLLPVQACIAFQDEGAAAGSFGSEVCTPASKVQLLSNADSKERSELGFTCNDCQEDSGFSVLGMPFWLFLLLLVIVLLVIMFALYGHRLS